MGHHEKDYSEDWPITLPGEKKIINSKNIKDYLTREFFFYYDIFIQMKYNGDPLPGGWLHWPEWLRQLNIAFKNTYVVVENYNMEKAYKR